MVDQQGGLAVEREPPPQALAPALGPEGAALFDSLIELAGAEGLGPRIPAPADVGFVQRLERDGFGAGECAALPDELPDDVLFGTVGARRCQYHFGLGQPTPLPLDTAPHRP